MVFEELAQMLDDGMSLPDFYEELLIRTGYVDMLNAKDTEENKTRLENVRELKSFLQWCSASKKHLNTSRLTNMWKSLHTT